MKISLASVLAISFFLSFTHVRAQRCAKKELAGKDMLLDFDYRGQSYYNDHKSGDTVKINAVIYAKQEYRVFTASDSKIGKVQMRIKAQTKAIRSVVKQIVPKQTPKGTINDTIWGKEAYNTEAVIYDSNEEGSDLYWETNTPKTRLVTIEAILPRDMGTSGCIQVMIGRKFTSSKMGK